MNECVLKLLEDVGFSDKTDSFLSKLPVVKSKFCNSWAIEQYINNIIDEEQIIIL